MRRNAGGVSPAGIFVSNIFDVCDACLIDIGRRDSSALDRILREIQKSFN
jgi:hypothetical protein